MRLSFFAEDGGDDCIADFAFKAASGCGDTCLAGKVLFEFGYAKSTFPREANTGNFHNTVDLNNSWTYWLRILICKDRQKKQMR